MRPGPKLSQSEHNKNIYCFQVVHGVFSAETAANIFIHELGHSLGAKHDGAGAHRDGNCQVLGNNAREKEGGHYLMTSESKVSIGQKL